MRTCSCTAWRPRLGIYFRISGLAPHLPLHMVIELLNLLKGWRGSGEHSSGNENHAGPGEQRCKGGNNDALSASTMALGSKEMFLYRNLARSIITIPCLVSMRFRVADFATKRSHLLTRSWAPHHPCYINRSTS
jgi:hypothetical protein